MLIGTWIKGFEGTHSITEDGTLYRYNTGAPIVVAQCKHNQGYLYSTLTRNKRHHNVLIHRVLAETFISNPDNKEYINHKDGNKQNNLLSNLEWVTAKENTLHAYNAGINPHKKCVVQYTVSGILIATFYSIEYAQIAMGHPGKKNIWCALNLARCKTAYGYIWRYLNEEAGMVESIKPSKV